MAMNRAQLRRAAIIAKCKAAKDKPLERRRVKSSWNEVASAVDTTRIEIEFERLGLRQAA